MAKVNIKSEKPAPFFGFYFTNNAIPALSLRSDSYCKLYQKCCKSLPNRIQSPKLPVNCLLMAY